MVAGREYKTYGTFKKQEGIIYVYYNDNGSFDDTAAYFYNRSLFHSKSVSYKIDACLADVNGDNYDDILISINSSYTLYSGKWWG